MAPKVSFIVPCYNLAHFLPDCINSILSQTYSDFEVLIMDDCSPDQTPEIAQSFRDSRVRYIRNEQNLGHLRNYNKSIGLAQGEYVWLISADDSLRKLYILEQYVRLMDNHPAVGYAFCPAIGLRDNQEEGLLVFTSFGPHNTILKGHDFLRKLLKANCVASSSAMARKECYERLSLFPLNMPMSGDWYLWCLFALYYDVAYFAEPMINRCYHDSNMGRFFEERPGLLYAQDMAVLWRIKRKAEESGYPAIVNQCTIAIGERYARQITPREGSKIKIGITLEEFEESLCQNVQNPYEEAEIRAQTYAELGDYYYWEHDLLRACQYYEWAIQHNRRMWRAWAKYVALRTGNTGVRLRNTGVYLRDGVFPLRRQMRRS